MVFIKIRKPQINDRIRERIVPIVVVVIMVLGTVLFGGRLVNAVYRQREINVALEGKIVVLENKIGFLGDIYEPALEKQVMSLEYIFPSRKPALNLLSSLANLAADENVLLSSITVNPGKVEEEENIEEDLGEAKKEKQKGKAPTPQDFTLDFSVSGGMREIGSFIATLEKTAPLMKIEEFSLSLSRPSPLEEVEGTSDTASEAKVRLLVRVFYQDLPKTLEAIDQPLPAFTAEELSLLELLDGFRAYEPVQPLAPRGKENLFGTPFSL